MSNQYTPVEYPTQTSEKKKLVPGIYVTLGIIAVLVLTGLFIWLLIWLAQTQAPTIEAMRDILIIGLALESCLFGVVLLLLLVMIIRLVNMLEFEIKPILERTNKTIGTIQGTTTFVSQNVVQPVTKVKSTFAGIRSGLATLFGNPDQLLDE